MKLREAPIGAAQNSLIRTFGIFSVTSPVARWHRPTHCVSIPAGLGRFGIPPRRTDPGIFFDCPSPGCVANYFLERRNVRGGKFSEANFCRTARGQLSFPST